MKNNKKGISLIVLVITIIVMIILAASIILSLNGSQLIENSKKAKLRSDVSNYKEELAAYINKKTVEDFSYDINELYAMTKVGGEKIDGKYVSISGGIESIIPSLKDKDEGFYIVAGNLVVDEEKLRFRKI